MTPVHMISYNYCTRGMPEQLAEFLNGVNIFFCSMFVLELAVKIIGLGPFDFFKDGFDTFDFIVTAISVIELILSGNSSLTALRTFRLLRLLRLLRHWTSLLSLISAVILSLEDLIYFSAILMLFVFIYAILGQAMFRGKFYYDSTLVRPNFDSFGWSLITVFQILTAENWNDILYTAYSAVGIKGTLYVVSLFLLGNYLVLATLLAIMLGHFDKREELQQKANDELKELRKSQMSLLKRQPAPSFYTRTKSKFQDIVDWLDNDDITEKVVIRERESERKKIRKQAPSEDSASARLTPNGLSPRGSIDRKEKNQSQSNINLAGSKEKMRQNVNLKSIATRSIIFVRFYSCKSLHQTRTLSCRIVEKFWEQSLQF